MSGGLVILAELTQEEVLRSIGGNVSRAADGGKLLALLLAVAGLLIVLLVVVNHRRQRQVAPKALNHPGKLLKEVARELDLKPAELKRLRMLADQVARRREGALKSPLTLLLCPSVLAQAMKETKK